MASTTNENDLVARRVINILEQALALSTSHTSSNRHFAALHDSHLSEANLRSTLGHFHLRLLQQRFCLSITELWIKLAKTYGLSYANATTQDDREFSSTVFVAYCGQQDRAAKVCLTCADVKREIEAQVGELREVEGLVSGLMAEKEGMLTGSNGTKGKASSAS